MNTSPVPLYRKMAERIAASYVKGKSPGTRLPTVRDLELEMEVSFATIRAALKVLETAGQIERRQGSGTYVRQGTSLKKHVAVLLEADISDRRLSPFYLDLLQEVRLALLKHGLASRPYLGYLRVDVEIGELTCREFLDELEEEKICGVISLFAKTHPTWSAEVAKRDLPVIGERGGANLPVTVDSAKLVAATLQHFSARNRKRLAILRLKKETPGSIVAELNAQAPAYGISLEYFPISLNPDHRQQHLWENFRAALNRTTGSPEGVFVSDDTLFEGFVHATRDDYPFEDDDVVVYASDSVPLSSPFGFVCHRYSTRLKAQLLAEAMSKKLRNEELPARIAVPFSTLRSAEFSPDAALR